MAKLIDEHGNIVGDTNEKMANKRAGLMEYAAQIKEASQGPSGPVGAEAPIKVKGTPAESKTKGKLYK